MNRYKLLNEVLIEWNESPEEDSDNVFLKSEDIKKSLERYFIYRLDERNIITIFGDIWPEYEEYRNKVWINGEHVELDDNGRTVDKFTPGEYKVYIKDINKVTDMTCMFYNCEQLVSAFIPNSVTSIGIQAFFDCSGLMSVTIPNSITFIDIEAFCRCSNLTSVIIPNSVTSIDDGVFYDCTDLTSVTIPNSVTTIGEDAFWNCNNLKTVYVEDINKFKQIQFRGETADPTCYGAKVIELKK